MHAPSAAAQARGWQARLDLEFGLSGTRTVLVHRRHSGPLLVLRPLYPEPEPGQTGSGPCHVYVIHPPGGVVSGDELKLQVRARGGAHALLTTPAAGKYYRRGEGGAARMVQEFHIAEATLEWLPQENIFYPDADAELSTVVRLAAAGRFIGWEITCLGLPANQRTLGDGAVRQSLELWREGAPVLLERLALDRACLVPRWGLAGCAALGTWLACPATTAELERARALAADSVALCAAHRGPHRGAHRGAELAADCAGLTLACTLVDDVLVCRAWAQRADQVRSMFVNLWSALRPALIGRSAVHPRIWAT